MEPKKLRFYLWDEVVIHNKKDDCWVVIHRNVLDLTPMIRDRLDHWNAVGLCSHQKYYSITFTLCLCRT